MSNPKQAQSLFSTPAEQAANHLAWYDSLLAGDGVRWGIPAVDDVVIPARAGKMHLILARPGHGKTSLLAMLAKREAERIQRRREANPDNNEVVVYVTWESGIEDLVTLFYAADGGLNASDIYWGRVPRAEIAQRAAKWVHTPIWTIGYGYGINGKGMPVLTPARVIEAIEAMSAEYQVKPTLLCFDYLQLIPLDKYGGSRAEQVEEAVNRVKQLAGRVNCPVYVGAQAKREADAREWKVPQKSDVWYSSVGEHASDAMFGLWRPTLTEDNPFLKVRLDGKEVLVKITPELFIMELLKQRGDAGFKRWVMSFTPQYLRLAEMEFQKAREI